MTNLSGSDRPIPSSAEEALEIGRTQFPSVWPGGTPVVLKVHEFDVGYLIHAHMPPPADPTAPPEPGGSNIVISKLDGEITDVPNYPVETAVSVYRQFHRPAR
ncbi:MULTISPECIES: hypothetical protein [unclassified Streptomyces]|uniref:hypothetical protein n=1 Tax=unclassified Streptomyces TaxID=2593676 RepID=UPI00278C01AC|nr:MULTISPECIES: hypothetical protein [unclassified Streptomyces]